MTKKNVWISLAVVVAALALIGVSLQADEFTDADVERWQNEYMSVVADGRALWGSADLGTNGVAYPKFQQQLGRVIALREMINWCLMNPLEGEVLELDDPRMIALEAYITYERRGVALDPGKH